MKPAIFYILLLFLSVSVFSQEAEITVEYITIQNGLADNNVNCIVKDQTGLMWFGTNDGITRYDGYTLKTFRPDNKHLLTLDLHTTSDGLLWCASTTGLHCFDLTTEKFIASIKNIDNSSSIIPSNRVSGIASGTDHTLWITTNEGLCHLSNIARNQLGKLPVQIKVFNCKNSGIPSDRLTRIINDQNGSFWIGTTNQLLINYNPSTNRSLKMPDHLTSPGGKKITTVNTIFEQNNTLWIGTMGGGVVQLDKSTLEYEVISRAPEKAATISHEDIYGIQTDGRGNLWLGTWNGIDRIHFSKSGTGYSSIDNFNWDHPYFNEKLENRITTLYYDDSGVMWIGTFGGGVVKINLNSRIFQRVKLDSRYEVKAFSEDRDGFLWVSTYHGGIKKSSQKTGTNCEYTFTNYTKDSPSGTVIKSNIILCSANDKNGDLWFGTDQSSLYHFNSMSKKFEELKIIPENQHDWKGIVKALCIDPNGNFWIGTSNGLVSYSPKTKKIHLTVSDRLEQYSLNHNHIRSLLLDSKGDVWVGTNNGLNKLTDKNNSDFRLNHFNDINIPGEILENKEVWSVFEDRKGRLWIGYRGGLGLFDPNNNEVKTYDTREGLCNNFVSCITEDQKGNLWLGTNSGISQFNPEQEIFTNYYIANNNRAAFKDSHGYLYFGNNNGFLCFHPDSIHPNEFTPPVAISDLKIKNVPVDVGAKVNGQVILNRSLNFTSHIELNHRNNSFTLDFAALSYLFQDLNKYAYKLEGYHEEWIQANFRSRSVTYNNLEPGEYTFLVKASNNDGIWSKEPRRLSITILTPWWRTWWAISLLVFLISWAFLQVYIYRINQIIKKQEIAAAQTKLEHNLEIAQIEGKKEKELSEMKSRFFTNISHEFRTPLTLIISPLNDLLDSEMVPKLIKKQLKPVNDSASRLLKLINQLLDIRKIETSKMNLSLSNANINSFALSIFNTFNPIANQNNINYQFVPFKKPFMLWFDRDKIETVISNLLANAFKFTSAPGKITLKIELTVTASGEFCKIIVSDTGKGIAQIHQEHIFDRYYQVDQGKNSVYGGTGIGLALVKDLVGLHKGQVWVESEPDKGASFVVILPLGTGHFSPDDIVVHKPGNVFAFSEPALATNPEIYASQSGEVISEQKGTILIVEDSPEIMAYVKGIFLPEYHVVEATDGKMGFNQAISFLPDLVISDIMMPEMNGIDLCKKIKTEKKTCHIPVILLTAKVGDTDKIEGLQTDADDYITKPFQSSVLKAKVESIIHNRRRLKEYFSRKITLGPTDLEIEPYEEKFLKNAINLVEQNLTNPAFNAVTLATSLNMSQPTLYRKIKSLTSYSISGFIRSIRLKRAAQLIKLNKYPIAEVSDMVGISDQAYFRKSFLMQFGVNPSQYSSQDKPGNIS